MLFVTDADDCINIECKNGATCLDGVGTFNCKCVQGYEGTYCEKGKTCNQYRMNFSICKHMNNA